MMAFLLFLLFIYIFFNAGVSGVLEMHSWVLGALNSVPL